jgi:hypothetical protein
MVLPFWRNIRQRIYEEKNIICVPLQLYWRGELVFV